MLYRLGPSCMGIRTGVLHVQQSCHVATEETQVTAEELLGGA